MKISEAIQLLKDLDPDMELLTLDYIPISRFVVEKDMVLAIDLADEENFDYLDDWEELTPNSILN